MMAIVEKKTKKKTARKIEQPTGSTKKAMASRAAKAGAKKRKRDGRGRFS